MAKPVEIKFVADVAQYLRDTKKVEVSTQDIADALVSVSNDGADLERKLGKAMRDAAKDTQTLENAIKDLPKATDRAADAAKKDFGKIGDAARDAGQEAGDEFRSNLGESLSSGNLEDVITDTLGGLVSSLKGPLGLLGAAAAGVAVLAVQNVRKEWETTMAGIEGLYQNTLALIQEQNSALLTQQDRHNLINETVREQPDLYRQITDDAAYLDMTLQDVLDLQLQGGDALQDQKNRLREIVDANTRIVGPVGQQYQYTNETAKSAQRILDYLNASNTPASNLARDWQVIQSASGATVGTTQQIAAAAERAAAAAAAFKENIRAYSGVGTSGGRQPLGGGKAGPI